MPRDEGGMLDFVVAVVRGVTGAPKVRLLGVALRLALSAKLSFVVMNVVSPSPVLVALPLCSTVEVSFSSRSRCCLLNRLIDSAKGTCNTH